MFGNATSVVHGLVGDGGLLCDSIKATCVVEVMGANRN
jgi:hypothetical protein